MRAAKHLMFIALAVLSAWTPASGADERSWDDETLELFAALPVQDEGRVKPLDTYARFKLLKLNGRRSFRDADGRSGSALEWLLDCLFFPELAARYETFVIDNSEVLVVLGLPEKNRRDRYAYEELAPARERLYELAGQYGAKPGPRPLLENQVINLANNVHDFELLAAFLDFARHRFDTGGSEFLRGLIGGKDEARLSEILPKGPQLAAKFIELSRDGTRSSDFEAIGKVVHEVEEMAATSTAIALLTPADREQTEWLTPGEAIRVAFVEGQPAQAEPAPAASRLVERHGLSHAELLAGMEQLVDARSDPGAFRTKARELCSTLMGQAVSRGEYEKIPLEVAFYRLQFFYYALVLYILSFLLIAFQWLRSPKSRVGLWRAANLALVALPTVLLIAGIVMRSIIRGRPPVTTLYETILFCTAVAAVVSLFIEFVNRQRIALSVGALLGVAGMFLANKYEVREGADTMPSMVAVLDTNFWLATHVTTIAIGYGAGLLASAMAHVYVFGRLLNKIGRIGPIEAEERQRALARTVYGVLCFSLLFSVLGTVLGGIWANESWGRFWGWDPKENGALMIVLWQLAILHARRGGLIGDLGVNLAVIAGGLVIAFSWFGVNLLGVGLHSYGFTTGTFAALAGFFAVEGMVIVLGAITQRQRCAEGQKSP